MHKRCFIELVAFLFSGTCLGACHEQTGGQLSTTDSTHYQLCETDADCPGGAYCQSGVCDADCSAQVACKNGQGCDERGKCGGALDALEPFAGQLTIGQPSLDFSLGQRAGKLTVQNTGSAAIDDFHALSDNPAVVVTPARGALGAGQSADLTVTLNPAWAGLATIRVVSSGGTTETSVTSRSGLVGYWHGTVNVAAPYALGPADLALDIHPDLAGTVDGASSLLWPSSTALTATDDGKNATVTFRLVADPGTIGNLSFGTQIQRVVTLSGSDPGSGGFTGRYTETVSGPGWSPASTVSGTFTLDPAGPPKGLVAVGTSAMGTALPRGAQPVSTACPPDPSCPQDLGDRANWFFAQAFPFEQWAQGSSIVNGECQISQQIGLAPCTEPELELRAESALAQGSDPTRAWEVLRAEASDALLQANDVIANVLEPDQAAYDGAQLDAQKLAGALTLLQQGLHENAGAGGLLAGQNFLAAQKARPSPSQLDKAPDDTHRFGGVVQTELLAAAQEVDRLARSGQSAADVGQEAQQQATGAFLDAAALGTLDLDGTVQVQAGAGALLQSETQFESLAAEFDRAIHGLNTAGYAPSYIPFDYDPSQPSADLFQQMLAIANQQVGAALTTEDELRQSDRDFEASSNALQNALQGVASQAQTEVVTLCGSGVNAATGAGCGAGGRIGEDFANAQAAELALQEAATGAANAAQKLQLLQQQAATELGDQQGELTAVAADGQEIELVVNAKANDEANAQIASCVGDLLSAIGSVVVAVINPLTIPYALSSAGAATSGCISAAEAEQEIQQSDDQQDAENDEQLQMLIGQQEIQDDQMEAQIFDANTASQAAAVEAQRQASLFQAAIVAAQADVAALKQALLSAQSSDQVLGGQIDPTFRLFRDQTGMQWADQMETARTWAFLATQAYQYTVNASYSNAQEVFADGTASELSAYLLNLSSQYQQNQLQVGEPQDEVDFISLRRDVLGFTQPTTDAVTGEVITPSQHFRAFLSLPQNRDSNGNLKLTFSTDAASGGTSLFSADVCQDVVADLKVNLVSTSLTGATAYVGLTQQGEARLANCGEPSTATSYTLSPKTALITAGLNLARSEETDSAYPANTDLFERPVLAGHWTLSIDQSGDPRNAWVDVGQLEDIELWIHHRALTLQSP